MSKFKPKNFECLKCGRRYYRWVDDCYGCKEKNTLKPIELDEAETNKHYQEIKQALKGTGLYPLIEEIEHLRKTNQHRELYIETLEEKCKWGEQQYKLLEKVKQENEQLKRKIEQS